MVNKPKPEAGNTPAPEPEITVGEIEQLTSTETLAVDTTVPEPEIVAVLDTALIQAPENKLLEVPVEWEQEFNPAINEKAISIIEQPDGNWKGYAKNRGALISVRAGDPQTVLTQLITHP